VRQHLPAGLDHQADRRHRDHAWSKGRLLLSDPIVRIFPSSTVREGRDLQLLTHLGAGQIGVVA
jgi:hypothetical protein